MRQCIQGTFGCQRAKRALSLGALPSCTGTPSRVARGRPCDEATNLAAQASPQAKPRPTRHSSSAPPQLGSMNAYGGEGPHLERGVTNASEALYREALIGSDYDNGSTLNGTLWEHPPRPKFRCNCGCSPPAGQAQVLSTVQPSCVCVCPKYCCLERRGCCHRCYFEPIDVSNREKITDDAIRTESGHPQHGVQAQVSAEAEKLHRRRRVVGLCLLRCAWSAIRVAPLGDEDTIRERRKALEMKLSEATSSDGCHGQACVHDITDRTSLGFYGSQVSDLSNQADCVSSRGRPAARGFYQVGG